MLLQIIAIEKDIKYYISMYVYINDFLILGLNGFDKEKSRKHRLNEIMVKLYFHSLSISTYKSSSICICHCVFDNYCMKNHN